MKIDNLPKHTYKLDYIDCACAFQFICLNNKKTVAKFCKNIWNLNYFFALQSFKTIFSFVSKKFNLWIWFNIHTNDMSVLVFIFWKKICPKNEIKSVSTRNFVVVFDYHISFNFEPTLEKLEHVVNCWRHDLALDKWKMLLF